MNIKSKVSVGILAISLALGSAAPAIAQRTNTSETNPTPTTEVTRTNRETERREKLPRYDSEWSWESERGFDVMLASRMDMESHSVAESAMYFMTDPDFVEQELDTYVLDTFGIREDRNCEGLELDADYASVYMVVCADGRYINMVMGTDKNDVIDAALDMQDGYVPTADGYIED